MQYRTYCVERKPFLCVMDGCCTQGSVHTYCASIPTCFLWNQKNESGLL